MQCFFKQICEDEIPGLSNAVKRIKASHDDIMPEVCMPDVFIN